MIQLPLVRRLACLASLALAASGVAQDQLQLNEQEYLEMTGLNVMLAHDYYPESHQGGVGIIHHGLRIATNGDLRLEPTPGQWQPTPVVGPRQVDRGTQTVSVRMSYPDPKKNRQGFNPIVYPDLNFSYVVRVRPEGKAFRIQVDLDQPLPAEWIGRVGFNLELFPGYLFGRSFRLGDTIGIFPRQANGPAASPRPLLEEFTPGTHLDYELAPLGRGPKLLIAPERDEQRMTIEAVRGGELELLDGRAQHTNGWFVVRALVPADATERAIEWLVTPHVIADWKSKPVVQVSQVGYHPRQEKVAVIELDRRDDDLRPITLLRATDRGLETVLEQPGTDWGRFLRYRYLQLDFSSVQEPGLYVVRYGDISSSVFQIDERVYQRHVWQPTVEYFLPAQMCHMRVNDRYRVWHDTCHLDDALMAPINHNHFDGYIQGASTLTTYSPGQHVPGLNVGGWHDAGDYDLRVESQAGTIQWLAHAWELFRPDLDNTWIDQTARVVEVHRPDGRPDVLQQIEHGALSIVAGHKSLGRLYRGIISPTLRQYVHLGDASAMSDNAVFDGPVSAATPPVGQPGSPDDRWVFTEENPRRELEAVAGLAAAGRALRGYNDALADDCVRIAEEVWAQANPPQPLMALDAAVELLQTTGKDTYAEAIVAQLTRIEGQVDRVGWIAARALPLVKDENFRTRVRTALQRYREKVDALERETPYGVPYKPDIWGAGWGIQRFGVEQYFLHAHAPDIFPATYLLHALNFVLGVHPGPNTASFASGVGAHSLTTAYGTNRADWSYIPGGVGSGTALIRPDFPEMLTWPFLWQHRSTVEQVVGRLVPSLGLALLMTAALLAGARAAGWQETIWQGERAFSASDAGWRATVSVERGRLIEFGPDETGANLLFAPASRTEAASWGGHRVWLGPQSTWPRIWPPPAAWEASAAETATVEADTLVLTLKPTGDGWPRVTRTYRWSEGRLLCGVRTASDGARDYQIVQIIQIPASARAAVEVRASAGATSDVVGLPAGSRAVIERLSALPAHAEVHGNVLHLRHIGRVEKLGFQPRPLRGHVGPRAFALAPGTISPHALHTPDEGYSTQVYLGGNEPFIELEQLSPLWPAGQPAVFEVVLTPVRE